MKTNLLKLKEFLQNYQSDKFYLLGWNGKDEKYYAYKPSDLDWKHDCEISEYSLKKTLNCNALWMACPKQISKDWCRALNENETIVYYINTLYL